jgi:hypothetical protein
MSFRPLRRLFAFLNWGASDRDMDQEMGFHLDAITRD